MINIKVEEVNGCRDIHQKCSGLGSEIIEDLEYAVASILVQIMPVLQTDEEQRIDVATSFAINVCRLLEASVDLMETKTQTSVHTAPGLDDLLAKLHSTTPPKDKESKKKEAEQQLLDYISKATDMPVDVFKQKIKEVEAAFGGTNNE